MQFKSIKVEIPDQRLRGLAAKKHYDRGFVRYVLTRAVAFAGLLFVINVVLLLRSRTATASNLGIVAVICAVGGILLGVGRWMYLLRVLRRRRGGDF